MRCDAIAAKRLGLCRQIQSADTSASVGRDVVPMYAYFSVFPDFLDTLMIDGLPARVMLVFAMGLRRENGGWGVTNS